MVFLIISSIIVAIILGYITRHNVGIFAMIFAYIIGAFFMDLAPKKIIAFWPISIFLLFLLSHCFIILQP